MRTLLLLAALAVPTAALAQVPSQAPGEPVTPQEFPARPHRSIRERNEPVALALDLAMGATVWNEVQVSTAGSLGDLNLLVHDGFYKREIIELVLISVDARRPLREVVDARRKGKRLSTVAHEFGLDAAAIENDALTVERTLDREYLPRFPDHTLKRLEDD